MIQNFINQYNAALLPKKEELLSYVENQIHNIEFPNQPAHIPTDSSKTALPKYCLGGGLLAILLGLALGKNLFSISGSVAVAGGLYMLNKQKKAAPSTNTNKIDYPSLTQKLYKELEKIHTFVSNEWDNFLGTQKNTLKKDIRILDIDVDKKNKMLGVSMLRSVISMSMLETLSALCSIEKKQDIEEYKQYIISFQNSYKAIIEKAYKEQLEIYKQVEDAYTL